MKESTKKILLIVGIGLAAVALAAYLCVYFLGRSVYNSETIFPGVCIAGENIGGLTKEEAEEVLEEKLTNAQKERTFTVHLPDQNLTLKAEDANPMQSVEEIAEAAVAFGRERGPVAAWRTYRQCKKSGHVLNVQDYREINREYIRGRIDHTAARVLQEKTQSEIVMDEENELLTITLGYNGRHLNADDLEEKIIRMLEGDVVSDFTYSYDIDPYDIVDLQPYYEKYCTPARNAYYNTAEKKMMPEEVGYGFDLVAVNAQIALAEEGSVLEVKLGVMEPTITVEEYNRRNYPDVLGSYQSAHTYDNNRTTNLRLACQAIDGTVLSPGEVFSFNALVGDRTAEKGYKEGIIYADGGESELEAGGGICQVVSSVYMCALTADLQIVERQPHMYPVGYVKPGCDATVYWGAVDFKFKNSTSNPIKVNAEVSGGMVKVSIVGTNEHDYTVKMSSQLIETIPYEEVETVDPTKPEGYREQTQAPHTGYVYWSYKNYYSLNGAFLRTEKCAISEYTKYDAEYIVGPGGEEEEEEKEEEKKEDTKKEPTKPNKQPAQTTEKEDEQADLGNMAGRGPGINSTGGKKQYRN